MITNQLHKQPVPLDREQHRRLKVAVPLTDWSIADKLNSVFLTAVEFGEACREFPIVFVRAGNDADGKPQMASVAVFGLAPDENLYVQGTTWRAAYLPALLRLYPFCIGRIDDKRFAVCVDTGWPGTSEGEGQPLFQADGQPTELMKSVEKQMENLEREVQRTRFVGNKLMEMELLRDVRFDATLPDGQKISADGFLTVDEAKLNALPDAKLLELQRSGLLGLVHAHVISMGNMRRLAEWRAQRIAAAATRQ